MEKTWFITGCSSGFGYEMAKWVLENDGRVVATARNIDKIREWENDFPGRAMVLSMDVTKQEEINTAVASTLKKYQAIDVLINNAGYGIIGAIEELSDEEQRKISDTNVFGLMNVTRALLPVFRKQKSGVVVNFSSIAGVRGSAGPGAYCASKFAVEGLSEALAEEVSPLGIKVIIIEPGGFRTNCGGSSMAFAKDSIKDYEETSGRTKSFFASANMEHMAVGDPKKLAKAVIEITLHENPPRRLALGYDSYVGIRNKILDVADGTSAAREILNRLPGIRIVKAFNTLYSESLLSNSFSGPRIVIPLASDDKEAKGLAETLISTIGFAPIDLGGLENVHLQENGGPFYNKVVTLAEAQEMWNDL